jgi:serine/threonine-protein kinase
MSTSDPAADDTRTDSVGPSVELEVDSELQPGTWIGEYQIEAKLGQGGMASVYAGVQPVIGKKVAVKVMSRRLCLDPVQVERFMQEARAVNQIGHPNIVDVFAFGTLPDGRSYHVMEWLQGETLAARLRRGWLPLPEAVAIMFQICDGLAAAHDKGIVHRDLKPENIFLVPVRNRRMLVKILDFGIAKLLGRRDSRVDRTAEGMTPGTPSYMSPEQTRGKDVDHRTDIYSLGVTAFEMLCGRLPFLGADAVEVLYQHIHAAPPAPSTLRRDLPLQLERLVLHMMEKKPDRRPTIPVIEERLADLRDGPLAALGDSGPQSLRALEGDSGGHRALTSAPAPYEATDSVVAVPRNTPPRALVVLALVLLGVALGAAVWKLTRSHAGAATARTAVEAKPATREPTPEGAKPTEAAPAEATPTEATPAEATQHAATATATATATAKPAHAAAKPAKHRATTPPRHDEPAAAAAAPRAKPPANGKPNRDYMIDPFATPKK